MLIYPHRIDIGFICAYLDNQQLLEDELIEQWIAKAVVEPKAQTMFS